MRLSRKHEETLKKLWNDDLVSVTSTPQWKTFPICSNLYKPGRPVGIAMAEPELILYRTRFRKRWRAKPPKNRRNNDLSPAIGLLELSNALDFAANVWNAIPPPMISKVFMALGATGALIILAFAVFDFPRAWRNTGLLRQERARLLRLQKDDEAAQSRGLNQSDVQTYLDLNHRELGNEVIDRLGMGLLLGFGGLTVGIGTYLAMDGENPTSYLASNVITGYVGNVPAAIYGLMNAAWCVYGWRRAQRHTQAAVETLQKIPESDYRDSVAKAVEHHSKRVKIHASTNGIAGIAGGAGSLMTASAYIVPVCVWGYIILLPCAISAFSVNIYWRLKVNYDRYISEPKPMDHVTLLHDAALANTRERLLTEYLQLVHGRKAVKGKNLDQDLLKKFLTDWLTAEVAHLTNEYERQNEILKSLDLSEESKERQTTSNVSELVTSLEHIQARIDRYNALLSNLRLVQEEESEKRSMIQDVAEAVYEVIRAVDLFPRLCAKLANKPETASWLNAGARDSLELKIDPSSLQQRLAEDNASSLQFIQIANDTLLGGGVRQARSLVRYYCELCGCAFAQPPQSLLS